MGRQERARARTRLASSRPRDSASSCVRREGSVSAHLFKYLLRTCCTSYLQGTILGTEDKAVTKTKVSNLVVRRFWSAWMDANADSLLDFVLGKWDRSLPKLPRCQ